MKIIRPWRFWFTGGVAVVLAAASQAQPAQESDAESRRSAWSVQDTADRIERQVRRSGLPVFARLTAPGLRSWGDATLLLVLGSDSEHTVVVQTHGDGALALPLTVRVVPAAAGGAQVLFTDARRLAQSPLSRELPLDLMARVAALPEIIDAALAGGGESTAA